MEGKIQITKTELEEMISKKYGLTEATLIKCCGFTIPQNTYEADDDPLVFEVYKE